MQAITRRHQGFQKQVAIIAAHIAIPDTTQTRHQIQTAIAAPARKFAIIQAEHGQHPERNRPLRHHAAEGDAAHQETLPFGHTGQALQQHFTHHREMQPWLFLGDFGFQS